MGKIHAISYTTGLPGDTMKLELVAGHLAASIATVASTPCAVSTSAFKVGDIPRWEHTEHLYDDHVSPYHKHETKPVAGQSKGCGYLGPGLRIKPVLIGGRLSAGLVVAINNPLVLDKMRRTFGIPPDLIKSVAGAPATAKRSMFREYRPVVSQTYWNRPAFVTNPAMEIVDNLEHRVKWQQGVHRHNPPLQRLRNDSVVHSSGFGHVEVCPSPQRNWVPNQWCWRLSTRKCSLSRTGLWLPKLA